MERSVRRSLEHPLNLTADLTISFFVDPSPPPQATSTSIGTLNLMTAAWRTHCDMMILIRCIFLVLDRSFVLQQSGLDSLWDMSLRLFRETVLVRVKYSLVHPHALNVLWFTRTPAYVGVGWRRAQISAYVVMWNPSCCSEICVRSALFMTQQVHDRLLSRTIEGVLQVIGTSPALYRKG